MRDGRIMRHFSSQDLQGMLSGGSDADSNRFILEAERVALDLQQKLRSLQRHDRKILNDCLSALWMTANGTSPSRGKARNVSRTLSRLGGREATVSVDHLIQLHMSVRSVACLSEMNPLLEANELDAVTKLVTAVLLYSNRISQVSRCCTSASQLLSMVDDIKDAVATHPDGLSEAVAAKLRSQVQQKTAELVKELIARRSFMRYNEADNSHTYDPRFLWYVFNSMICVSLCLLP